MPKMPINARIPEELYNQIQESKPLMIDAPGEQNKRWWKFWV